MAEMALPHGYNTSPSLTAIQIELSVFGGFRYVVPTGFVERPRVVGMYVFNAGATPDSFDLNLQFQTNNFQVEAPSFYAQGAGETVFYTFSTEVGTAFTSLSGDVGRCVMVPLPLVALPQASTITYENNGNMTVQAAWMQTERFSYEGVDQDNQGAGPVVYLLPQTI